FQVAQQVEQLEQGVYRMMLDITPIPAVAEKAAERERVSAIASLKAFLKPHSIAVIGASRRSGSIGNKLFHNILQADFKGVVYPVNPNAEAVASVKAYPTITDIPGEIDLAIIIVPADLVQQTVEQCGRKGVRGIIVISSGFGETGTDGKKRQEKLLETVRSYGMRLVGPNCMGVINTEPDVTLNATFSGVFPPSGRIAFATQSGALGLAILEYASSLNMGLSTFASIGDRADVSSNDLLQYWQDDPATGVILLYLESFGNPKKFARIVRSVTRTKPVIVVKGGRTPAGTRTKPVIVVKGGRTPAGMRAAASHTGALATAEAASQAILNQVGVVRVDTLEELFDAASLFSSQPLPKGRRVAILTNGGGPGIMTADACGAHGLEVVGLSEKTVSGLKGFLRREASAGNPIDMTAEASAEDYGHSLQLLAEDDLIDIVIVIFVPPILTQEAEVAKAIREISPEFCRRGKTLVASFMGSHGASANLATPGVCGVPSFVFPEATAMALSRACEYSDWLKRPQGTVPVLSGVDKSRASQKIMSALKATTTRPFWLDADAVAALLGAYGIRMVKAKAAVSAEKAADVADEIGYPVAVKLLSDTIVHKTEVGGVILGVSSREGIASAYRQIAQRLTSLGRIGEMQGVMVQEMVSEGVEVIVGMTQDASVGPLLMFGLGGVHAELFKDVVFRIHPLTDIDAAEMVRAVKAYQLLQGWRGTNPSDIKSLEELLLRVSALVEDMPQVVELDLNPVMSLEQGKGYVVADARIRVG
ncbi:MAG: acetyltransferase, partial [Dehalococcoidia bacterium]|nr:acetyltransferase [Dehalococcoidia bacterium]